MIDTIPGFDDKGYSWYVDGEDEFCVSSYEPGYGLSDPIEVELSFDIPQLRAMLLALLQQEEDNEA